MINIDKKGFTLIELVIAAGIAVIIIWEIYNCFIKSIRYLSLQKEITDMQHNARASIEFITQQLKNISLIISLDCTEDDSSVSFFSLEETGTPTSSSLNTLIDSTKSWIKNEWKNGIVLLIDGNGVGQKRAIISNSATELTVAYNWGTIPDSTSLYQIFSTKGFSRDKTTDELNYIKAGLTSEFASNITSLTIRGYNSSDFYDCNVSHIDKLKIDLTARTSKPDTSKNSQYCHYTVTRSLKKFIGDNLSLANQQFVVH